MNNDITQILNLMNQLNNVQHILVDDLINILKFSKYFWKHIYSLKLKYNVIVRMIYLSDDLYLCFKFVLRDNDSKMIYDIEFKDGSAYLKLSSNEIIKFNNYKKLIAYFKNEV